MVWVRNPLTQSFDGAGRSDDLECWEIPLSSLMDEVTLIVLIQSLCLQDHLSCPSVGSEIWNLPFSFLTRSDPACILLDLHYLLSHPGSFTDSSFSPRMLLRFSFLKAPAPLPTQFQPLKVKKSCLQHS